ncbi:hypothetical protein [Pelomonas cellulosilytica]|uniref:Alpha/beta hydrolase n=1 Tax=Pelomonas cellulosilytica TaxID=2906762 RepID=A0ABS8Y1C2_9BURK|nr:hypothetical protein [Pelomonas sp. P8]MCE4556814.1 hypothetical protein [Pelomonas sp. P8]
MLDAVFYDTPGLRAALAAREEPTTAHGGKRPSRIVDFSALSDPAGSLLLIDATTEPYVHRYQSVEAFLHSPYEETRRVQIATVTGVGSSALGSAAFAWDISAALGQPVLAIVPGYGVADVVLQGLGGWFGFGMHDFLQSKSWIQQGLANVAPRTAAIGRELAASVPDAKAVHGAPVFRHGSGSSDVLHALMLHRRTPFQLLVGHSKGALQIGNAILSLPTERTSGLRVVTLGCPIAESDAGVDYFQYLGLFDALGQLNAWGHSPTEWVPTWHSTNPKLPPAMDAGKLTAKSAAERPPKRRGAELLEHQPVIRTLQAPARAARKRTNV